MSERPWTGGKWEAHPDTEADGTVRKNWVVVSKEANPINCYEVADCWGHGEQYDGAEADAKLIALAPRMAEALLELERLALAEIERMKGSTYVGNRYMTARVRLMVEKLKEIQ